MTEEMRPTDLIIFCPRCGLQHVDEPNGEWQNPPHRTHECRGCRFRFRVADVPTNGVRELKTRGQSDDPVVRGRIDLSRAMVIRYQGRDPGPLDV